MADGRTTSRSRTIGYIVGAIVLLLLLAWIFGLFGAGDVAEVEGDGAVVTGEAVEDAAEETGDAVGDAAEATGDAVGDAAEATEDAVEEEAAEEAN